MSLADKYTVEELRDALYAAEAKERAELEERRKSVKPKYKYTLVYVPPQRDPFDAIYDPECCFYALKSECINVEELKGARLGLTHTMGGQMKYVFNKATGRFVCAVGGGTLLVKGQEAWDALSEYIVANPVGGDVTEIVSEFKQNN